MRESRVTSVLTLGALLVLSVVVVFAGNQIAALDGRIAKALSRKDHTMQTLTQKVTRSNGDEVTVVTTRLDGETVTDFIARHDAVVAALKAS